MEIIKWLETHDSAIIVMSALMTMLATIVVAGANVALVWITRRQVRMTRDILEDNRQMRLEAEKPKIAIYPGEKYEALGYRNEKQSIYLCVENVSMGPAYDVNLELADPSFSLPTHHGSEVRLFKDIPLIAHGISYLPPGHDRSYRLSNANVYGEHNKLAQCQVQIKVTYKGSRRETYNDCIDVDFRLPASR